MKQLISIISKRTLFQRLSIPAFSALNILFLSILILASRCPRNQDKPAFSSTANDQLVAQTALHDQARDPSNKKNPYDNAGVLHNRLLDFAHGYIDLSGDTSRAGIHERIAQAMLEITGIDLCLATSIIVPAVDYGIATHGERHLYPYKLPSQVERYLDRLLIEFNNIQDANYLALKGRITMLEDEILQDGSLGKDEHWVLLTTTSVVRYSTAPWYAWAMGKGRLVFTMGLFGAIKAAVKAGMTEAAAIESDGC
jgi:cell division protein FtsL